MAQPISDFKISKTFDNVVLTTVSSEPDTDGIPVSLLPNRRTTNLALRNQGRIQDGHGTEAPLVISKNLIEVESDPASAYSVIRRADAIGIQASIFISNMIWS
jgi:hypothetical protein